MDFDILIDDILIQKLLQLIGEVDEVANWSKRNFPLIHNYNF